MIEVCILFTFGEAQNSEIVVDPGVPRTKCLFETIHFSLEYSQMILPIKCLETFLVLDVHLFINNSIEKCCFYIHLVDLPPRLPNQSKNLSNWWVPCYRRKCLLIVNSLNFWVSLGHKYGLVFHFSSIYCLLNLEYPSRTHNWFVCWSWDHFPNCRF